MEDQQQEWINHVLIVLALSIQAQGRISIVASPVTSGFEEDKSYHLRVSEGYMPELLGSERVNPTTSIFQEGNERNLDIGPHPVDIESGPPSEDRVRCRIKSIQPPGSRQQDKDSPPDKKKEFSQP
ncbi:hypothetical protein Bca101_082748 [Brassica carinata]